MLNAPYNYMLYKEHNGSRYRTKITHCRLKTYPSQTSNRSTIMYVVYNSAHITSKKFLSKYKV